jgi:fructose-1-phosphate kinase PfkB-like protein
MLSQLTEVPRLQLGQFVLTIELDDLTPELQEVARKELRENPDIVKPAIEELKQLLKGNRVFNNIYFYV